MALHCGQVKSLKSIKPEINSAAEVKGKIYANFDDMVYNLFHLAGVEAAGLGARFGVSGFTGVSNQVSCRTAALYFTGSNDFNFVFSLADKSLARAGTAIIP